MHWINNENIPLKQWVRNRVVEILRFSDQIQWRYITTSEMPADIGTRRGATLHDISEHSVWYKGREWMTLNSSDFPTKTYEEIKLKCIEASNATNELVAAKNEIQQKTAVNFLSIESTALDLFSPLICPVVSGILIP